MKNLIKNKWNQSTMKINWKKRKSVNHEKKHKKLNKIIQPWKIWIKIIKINQPWKLIKKRKNQSTMKNLIRN